ncbi:hypothetical protein PspLS_03326 [Pyricularia sp. CBS 133598]|nr:hypothetical protein PspLS_03326 [Pyricularia sp. CBS 133598]
MATAEATHSVSDLLEKIVLLEKRLGDLELKNSSVPLTEAALAIKDAANDAAVKSKASVKDPEENESTDPRVKVIISRINLDTGEPIEEDAKIKASTDDKNRYAFILRKNIYDNKRTVDPPENNSEIEIISTGLWKLLKEHLGHYLYHIFQRETPEILYSPYEPIVFYFDDLQDAADKSPTSEEDRHAREDLAKLLKIISNGTSGDAKLDKYFRTRPNYKKAALENKEIPRTIQFANLWTIFPPGTLVYGRPFQNERQVFLVRDNAGPWPTRRHGADYYPWKLWAWTYDWKDGHFVRTNFDLLFEQFEGSLPLTSLPFTPLDALPDGERDSMMESLIYRGKRFRQICEAKEGARLFEYKGKAVREQKGFSRMKNDDESNFDPDSVPNIPYDALQRMFASRQSTEHVIPTAKSTDVRSRVMVDYESYFQYGPPYGRNGALEPSKSEPPCDCSDCKTNTGLIEKSRAWLDDHKVSKAKAWKPEQYVLCPPRVLGYILKEKRWAQLQVTCLEDLPSLTSKEADEHLSRLQLADDPNKEKRSKKKDTSTKRLLCDLVRSHASSLSGSPEDIDRDRLEVDDIIPEKGKGLIILLYGPPGVGKTSTAEVISIATRKPLFSVSVADVGTNAKNVESNLSRIFNLATRWKAILLLDEADVFLESRSTGKRVQSADKNALVSVFLRVLEYYHGIMFLTTNNIATFDIAIPSRVHVAIRYESLNEKQMRAIFKGFLDKLDPGAIDDYDEILETWFEETIRKAQFDGRQIRNTVTVALGLARAAREDRGGDGKLTQEHLKMAFNNVAAFHNDFRFQMEIYKDAQKGMVK